MWVVGSKIVIGLYILDMWYSVVCPYVTKIVIGLYSGHVVSVVCSICGWWV